MKEHPHTVFLSLSIYSTTVLEDLLLYLRTTSVFIGSIDPWHWLSMLVDHSAQQEYSVFIPGTSHCADLGIPKASDPDALTAARAVCILVFIIPVSTKFSGVHII